EADTNQGVAMLRRKSARQRRSGQVTLGRAGVAQREGDTLSSARRALVGIEAAVPVILLVPTWRVRRRLAGRVDAGKRVAVEDIVPAPDDGAFVGEGRPSEVEARTETFLIRRSNVPAVPGPFGIAFIDYLSK